MQKQNTVFQLTQVNFQSDRNIDTRIKPQIGKQSI